MKRFVLHKLFLADYVKVFHGTDENQTLIWETCPYWHNFNPCFGYLAEPIRKKTLIEIIPQVFPSPRFLEAQIPQMLYYGLLTHY